MTMRNMSTVPFKESRQLCPSGKQKVTFCDIKAIIFNGSSSNFEHFSFRICHNFFRQV